MNAKDLDVSFQKDKKKFHTYIYKIKQKMPVDIYSISNITMIKNPYTSVFPLHFFSHTSIATYKWILFVKSTGIFYVKQAYFFLSYILSFFLFKIFYTKKTNISIDRLIDIFVLSENVVQTKSFHENYFKGLYEVFDNHNIEYTFMPRIYSTNKNPLHLIDFFKILSKDKRNFLFEFELLSFSDFLKIFWMIVMYPFKTLRLLQKEKNIEDKIFNKALLIDISTQGMNTFSRYILGKNIAKYTKVKHIIAWSEFQVIERSFNYAIQANNKDIRLTGCQFYLNYETYFNAYIDRLDVEQKTAFHTLLVNGDIYKNNKIQNIYKTGVSLRYKDVFLYDTHLAGDKILLLGSYIEEDTQLMLQSVHCFDEVLFKNHPAIDSSNFGNLEDHISIVKDNIYQLFPSVSLVIATASGTAVEAVACMKSVIIIASQSNLTANPLIEYGKGKIWDIAFSKDDVEKHYNKLIKYRNENPKEIEQIANWYKKNFFVEPTEENIVKAFELEG
jgi:hypothetical protein